ncbi:MAG: type II toxin-antitoxin system VapC family toxin, partial [Chloroflexi bacterium]|nr:type II toxin-antitoxin system VapC family toxin [Chloroflexota bacterium]
MVLDTNVLVCAAKGDSEFHNACKELLDRLIDNPSPNYLTWGIAYEFVRVVTHPRVYEVPWNPVNALSFIDNLLDTGNFFLLTETDRHLEVFSRTLEQLPGIKGSILHDVHTAVLMREHGIREICT